MSRKDLLALTPQAIASLANLGLVKRATREIEEGQGPLLAEESDGTVVGTFSDGTVARLVPGKTLKDSPCTCNALTVCRHRVAVALAYKAWHESEREKSRETNAPNAPPSIRGPASTEGWSPADIDDAVLERAVGKARMDAARASVRAGVLVTVERGVVPGALLPACTVRFLVPRDPAYAKCDCRDAGAGCEHVVIAVWAFRAASDREGDQVVVSLGGGTAASRTGEDAALDEARALVHVLLATGIAGLPPTFAARIAPIRETFDRLGCTWPLDAMEDLERALSAHAARSALYSATDVFHIACELEARIRASRSSASELPRRFVLGQDVASVTPLDHLRLVSLGARITADGRTRLAQVFLADPDTAMVLVLARKWEYAEKETPEDGPALGRRTIANRVALQSLAHGQLVSKVVKRRANRAIELGTNRAAMSSVTPQRGEWEGLPKPLMVHDLAEHDAWLRARAPRLLRPRLLAEDVHVVAISKVDDVVYLPSEQELVARLYDTQERELWLRLQHRRAAPHAVDAATAALREKVRFVSGRLVRAPRGFEITPLAIAADKLTVMDLAGPPAEVLDAPRATRRARMDPLGSAVDGAESVLAEILHVGTNGVQKSVLARAAAAAATLDEIGMREIAARVRLLAAAVEKHADGAPRAWLDAAIRVSLARESI